MAGFLHFAGSARLVAQSLNIPICPALGTNAQGGTYLLPACSPLPKTACESVEKPPGASDFSGQKESQLLPKASRNPSLFTLQGHRRSQKQNLPSPSQASFWGWMH